MAAFWRKERYVGPPGQRSRADLAFALRRHEVHRAAEVLGDSALLTEKGHAVVRAIRAETARWQADSVPEEVAGRAREIAALHSIRWRIANVIPDQEVIGKLAHEWLSDGAIMLDHCTCPPTVAASPDQNQYEGSRVLGQALTDPDAAARLAKTDDRRQALPPRTLLAGQRRLP